MKKGLVLVMTLFLAGCATTQKKAEMTQLQSRVDELEQQVNDKEDEIRSLSSEVRELNDELERARSRSSRSSSSDVSSSDNKQTIRVAASAKEVQSALKSAGYYQGNVDGKIGAMTKKAIADFQRDNNLKADGVVGNRTWTALKAYSKE